MLLSFVKSLSERQGGVVASCSNHFFAEVVSRKIDVHLSFFCPAFILICTQLLGVGWSF